MMEQKKFYEKTWFIILMLFIFPPVAVVLLWIQKKWNIVVRGFLTIFAVIFLYFFIVPSDGGEKKPNEEVTQSKTEEKEVVEKNEVKSNNQSPLMEVNKFELTTKVNDNGELLVNLNTDLEDGTLISFLLEKEGMMNKRYESPKIEIIEGHGEYVFSETSDWEHTYFNIQAEAEFFNRSSKQPAHILEKYGSKGELIESVYASKNILGNGKNIRYRMVECKYPSDEVFEKKKALLIETAINEMIESSDNIIIEIKPHEETGWQFPEIIVGDEWFYMDDYKRIRFAKNISELLQRKLIVSGAVVDKYYVTPPKFYDEYERRVATYSISKKKYVLYEIR